MVAASRNAAREPIATIALPLQLDQPVDATSFVAPGALIAVAAVMLLAPFSVVLAHAAATPGLLATTLGDPLVTVQLAGGLLIAGTFVAFPLLRLVRRARSGRKIEVGHDRVCATVGGQSIWSEPLSAYTGVTHHIRTSLSGTAHEIVLVHPESSKSIVLHSAPNVGKFEVEAMAELLKLGEVPPRTLYSRNLRLRTTAPALSAA